MTQSKELSKDREKIDLTKVTLMKNSKNSSSIELYQTIFENQTNLLKKNKDLNESNRLAFFKKDFLKIQKNSSLKSNRQNSTRKSTATLKKNNEKVDKIKELFIAIIKDQDDGIKSPTELNSSYRKTKRNRQKSQNSEEIINYQCNPLTLKPMNFPIPQIELTEIDKKSKFLSIDSKFQEIQELKKKNFCLKRKMLSLENELNGSDEFVHCSFRKTNENNLENFNEKRIAILKGQIAKQKKCIKNLHKSMRLIKKFYRDMTSILLLFKNLDIKYADMLKNSDKLIWKRTKNNIRNDLSILKDLDEKQKSESLQQIFHGSKNAEVLEKFMNNFNEAYEKVKGFERKNEELKKIFDITDAEITKEYKEKVKKIKYNYLLREFIQKYSKYLPIKTFFDILEPKDKDSIDCQITKLIKLMSRIEEVFQQISSFEKLKKNSFYSKLSIPERFKENIVSFEKFMNENQKKINMMLDSKEIFETESSLSFLLRDLSNLQIDFSLKKNPISLEQVMNLQKSLRKNIEKLLELGIVLNDDEDPLIILHNEAGFLNGSNIKDKNIENISFKTEMYKNENNCNHDFQTIHTFLQESVNDIEENIGPSLNEANKKKLHKFKYFLITSNKFYEQKKITSFLKELELEMQIQRIDLINKGFDTMKMQIVDKTKFFEEFLQTIIEKFEKLSKDFDLKFENIIDDKKNSVFSFGKKVQKILKLILVNAQKTINHNNNLERNVNLVSLESEYKVKIQVIEDKWNSFIKRINNILEKLNPI